MPRKSQTYRMKKMTIKQIQSLADELDLSQADVISLAVDRLSRDGPSSFAWMSDDDLNVCLEKNRKSLVDTISRFLFLWANEELDKSKESMRLLASHAKGMEEMLEEMTVRRLAL